MRNRIVVTALAAAAFEVAAGCGGVCHNVISAQREVRDSRPGAADGRPHAQLRLPHTRINLLLANALEAEPLTYEVPIAGDLPLPLPALSATAKRIEIVSARRGRVGFMIDVELALGEMVVTRFGATIEAAPQTTTTDGNTFLDVRFDADSLRAVRPEFGQDATTKAAGLIGRAVTAASGQKVPEALLGPVAKRFMQIVSGEAFELIRDNLLAKVGEVASLRVDLGTAPVERTELRTSDGPTPMLVVDVYTRLPILTGLAATNTAEPISGTGQLRIAGQAIAELGNWAIAEGVAPQAYDSQMRPDPNGAYVPVYAWRDGDLPLVVHAYRTETPCSTVVIGARPKIEVEDGQVVVGIEDGAVEKVSGSRLMRLGVGLKSFFSGDITKSKAGSSSARFEVAGRPVKARLLEANIAGNEVQFTVELTPLPATTDGASP